MPYFQANELLTKSNSSIEELVNAIEDLGIQYGYIVAMASQGLREDPETELVRILVLIKALKQKITDNYAKH